MNLVIVRNVFPSIQVLVFIKHVQVLVSKLKFFSFWVICHVNLFFKNLQDYKQLAAKESNEDLLNRARE